MKTPSLVILLLFSASALCAQCKVQSDKVDDFTGRRTIILNTERMGNTIVLLSKTDSAYHVSFWAGETIGCAVTGKSMVLLKMSDDSIIELPHVGKLDCKSAFLTINVSTYFDELTTLQVSKMRFKGSKSIRDVDVNKNPDLIKKGLLCLAQM